MIRKILFILFLITIPIRAESAVRYVNPDCASACDGTTWTKGWTTFANIVWDDLDDEESTLYISGGASGRTYAEVLKVSHNVDSRLYIKPGSASSTPTGHAGLITINNRTGGDPADGNGIKIGDAAYAKYVTIDGETTPGAGTRNIKIWRSLEHGIGYRFDGVDQPSNVFRYLDIGESGFLAATTLSTAATGSDTHIHVADATGFADNLSVRIILDNGHFDQFQIDSISGTQINLQAGETIEGTASIGAAAYLYDTPYHGIKINGGSDGAIIEYCYIHDNGADGINGGITLVLDGYGKGTIRYNTIENNFDDAMQLDGSIDVYNNTIDIRESLVKGTSFHADGIQGSYGYWRVYNNLFFASNNQVLFFENDQAAGIGYIIYNNVFSFDVGGGPALLYSAHNATGARTLDNFYFLNNTIDGNDVCTFGVRFVVTTEYTLTISTSEISNNIFYNIKDSNIEALDYNAGVITYVKAGLLVYNNIFYGDEPGVNYNASDDAGGPYATAGDFNTGTGFTGNTNSQSLFVDLANNNYRLVAEDTVAKNAGKTLSSYFTTDILGTSRPQGAAWDIGAYEYYPGTMINIGVGISLGPGISIQ